MLRSLLSLLSQSTTQIVYAPPPILQEEMPVVEEEEEEVIEIPSMASLDAEASSPIMKAKILSQDIAIDHKIAYGPTEQEDTLKAIPDGGSTPAPEAEFVQPHVVASGPSIEDTSNPTPAQTQAIPTTPLPHQNVSKPVEPVATPVAAKPSQVVVTPAPPQSRTTPARTTPVASTQLVNPASLKKKSSFSLRGLKSKIGKK